MVQWEPMMSGWMGAWMWIPSALVLLLVLVAVVAVVRSWPTRDREGDPALAIAARRFARGEITKEQFEVLRATLSDA